MSVQRKIPLRLAWYGLIILASLLPAIVLTPWLTDQAHELLLDRAMLKEEVFHKEMETRLHLETIRLVSVLQNKSDPIAYFLTQHNQQPVMLDLLHKINQREPLINTTTIYDKQGHILLSSHLGEHSPAPIRTDEPAFVIPMHQRVFIGSPERLKDNHFEFLISVPLTSNDQLVGIMVSTVNINDFWNSVRTRTDAHKSMIYLVDGRGSLMNDTADSRYHQGELLSQYAIVRSLLAHKDWHKKDAYTGMETSSVFGIGSRVQGLEWGIISEIPAQRIDSPIASALITLSIIVILLHVLFGLLSLLFTRRLLNPISELAAVMSRARSGDYEHAIIQPSIYREIDDLGTSFNSMVQQIDSRETALKKLNRAIEQMGETLIITNRDGIVEYVNPAFTRTTGYSEAEIIGRSPNLLNSDRQTKAFYASLWKGILAGDSWEGRLVNRKKDGSLYPVLMTIAPIYQNHEITHFVAVEQDMSEQNHLEDQLRQSQKMQAIGTLVGGIAHDFNNMLAGISGNLYLARQLATSSPDLLQKLENIDHLSLRAADMISQMLTFARKDRVNMKPLSLNQLIEHTLKFMRASIPENIAISQQTDSEPMPVVADETQLHQVLMNLINNARDAVQGSEHPTITISLDDTQPAARLIDHETARRTTFVHLGISDNGSGIPADQLDQIFEPFFTTKEQGKGTGLGLAMVFGAIHNHHGIIDVDSHEGQGTTFNIYLPLHTEPVSVKKSETQQTSMGKQELILLVDDEPSVLRTTAEVLKCMGYRVLTVEDGEQAFACFQAHADDIRLIISDVVMPRCGGVKLANLIRRTHAELPIIFITGYDEEHLSGETDDLQHYMVISKPVKFEKLSIEIRQLLDT